MSKQYTPPGVSISIGGGPMRPAHEPAWQMEALAAERAEAERILAKDNAAIERRNALVQPHDAVGPVHGWPEPSPDPAH
jgi:hypothetical protein